MDNILNTITAYRKERNWSLYDLAAHAELKPSTISTWYNKINEPRKACISSTSGVLCY